MTPDLEELKTAYLQKLQLIEEIVLLRETLAQKESQLNSDECLLASTGKGVFFGRSMNQTHWVHFLLTTYGPLTRDQLYEKMETSGKRPATPEQLSAILSREKKNEAVTFDRLSKKWSLSSK